VADQLPKLLVVMDSSTDTEGIIDDDDQETNTGWQGNNIKVNIAGTDVSSCNESKKNTHKDKKP